MKSYILEQLETLRAAVRAELDFLPDTGRMTHRESQRRVKLTRKLDAYNARIEWLTRIEQMTLRGVMEQREAVTPAVESTAPSLPPPIARLKLGR